MRRGAAGFEPANPSPPDWCANRATSRSGLKNEADARRQGGNAKGTHPVKTTEVRAGRRDQAACAGIGGDSGTEESREQQTDPLRKGIADGGNRSTPAVAVIQPSVAATTTGRQQIRLAITRRYRSPGAPAICSLGRPPARRRLRSAAGLFNKKLPVMPAHLPVRGHSLSRPSPRTATSLSASPFRQHGTAGDSDRKPKHGCAYC
jgi:hypothetical protein